MKKYLVVTSIMLGLIFLWWFSGGTIWGGYVSPSPAEVTLAFVWQNFNLGLATIFETLGNLIK